MTTAINIFLRQAIQYQGLPFDVRLDESRKLLEVLTDLDQNRNMSQSFESVSDLMEDLRCLRFVIINSLKKILSWL